MAEREVPLVKRTGCGKRDEVRRARGQSLISTNIFGLSEPRRFMLVLKLYWTLCHESVDNVLPLIAAS